MSWRLLLPLAACLSGLALPAAAQDTAAASTPLSLELNKLEEADGICRAYFIARNQTGQDVANLELDTFLFDRDAIILQRLALPFGPVGTRMRIVSFDFNLSCNAIGSVYVNDVLSCEPLEAAACAAALQTSSRAAAALD
ncbi:MAG: hypothetical protein AAGJ94_07605 [Pseudomonadota bacterium]